MAREETPETVLEESCPYLGTKADRDIAFTFPTKEHYCYKVKNASSVNLPHQTAFCLGRSYVDCKVYKEKRILTVPIDIQGIQLEAPSKMTRPVLLITGIGLLLFTLFSIFFLLDQNRTGLPSAQSELTATISDTPLAIELTVTQIAFEIDQIAPSATLAPPIVDEPTTETPTPLNTAGPGLATPFGPDNSLLLHEISTGESLGLLAELYGTSIELLRQINVYDEDLPVQVGEIWVVMPGWLSSSNLSVYAVHKVEPGDTLDSVANKLSIDVAELRELNSLGTGNELDAARWIIYPVERILEDG